MNIRGKNGEEQERLNYKRRWKGILKAREGRTEKRRRRKQRKSGDEEQKRCKT